MQATPYLSPAEIIRLSSYDRAHLVRECNDWRPLEIGVRLASGKPADLKVDANGDVSLWSRSDDYTGSLAIALI